MKKIIEAILAVAALPALADPSGAKIAGFATSADGMPAAEPNTNAQQEWDVFSLFDGNLGTYYNANWDAPANEVVFDAGAPRSITAWRFCRGTDASRTDGDLYVVLYGSDDGETWTELTQPTKDVVQVSAINGFSDQYDAYALDAPTAAYRYFKIQTAYYTSSWPDWNGYQLVRTLNADKGVNGYQGLDFREIELWSDDVMPVADLPQVYASGDLGAADRSEGVTLSGTLKNGSATVEVYCGRKDCGYDYEAWKRSTARSQSAQVEKDGTFSFTFANLDDSVYYWRAFAVVEGENGASVTASQATRPFAVGSNAVYPEAYVNSSQFWNSYNGSTGDWADSATVQWQIFDVGASGSTRDRLVSIRLWPRTGSLIEWYRIRGLRVYASYATDIDWSAFSGTGYPGDGRTIHYDGVNNENGSEPSGFDWQQIATGEILTEYPNGVVELPLPKLDAKPAYIKLEGIWWGNTKEVEFRTLLRETGLAIIFR